MDDSALIKAGWLADRPIEGRDGELGRLGDLMFDAPGWVVRYLVIRTGGWLAGRRVLIGAQAVDALDAARARVDVNLSRSQLSDCPPLEEGTAVSRAYERAFHRHFGWRGYWEGGGKEGSQPADAETGHLHSLEAVSGYRIGALDGDLGEVTDLIFDAADWSVRYLEVDTERWWKGRHVLLNPAWIKGIDAGSREVQVDLQREAIKTAPPYDPGKPIDHDYEIELFKHYGRKAYWE